MVANSSSYSGDGMGMDTEQYQFVNNRNYNFRPNNNLLTHFHLGLKNHENFSYANPRNTLQQPPRYPQPLAEKKPSYEEMLSTFIMETRKGFPRMRPVWIVLKPTAAT